VAIQYAHTFEFQQPSLLLLILEAITDLGAVQAASAVAQHIHHHQTMRERVSIVLSKNQIRHIQGKAAHQFVPDNQVDPNSINDQSLPTSPGDIDLLFQHLKTTWCSHVALLEWIDISNTPDCRKSLLFNKTVAGDDVCQDELPLPVAEASEVHEEICHHRNS